MQERRQRPRWKASYFFSPGKEYERDYFEVIDRTNGTVLGKLVDLTIDGLRITCPSELTVGKDYKMKVVLPTPVTGVDHIQIKARCVWSRKNEEAGGALSGFEIRSITPPYTEVIEILTQG